ncbi:MAG: hypothetical protein AB1505_13020 [Candidatus Latescibacterota bacterium]
MREHKLGFFEAAIAVAAMVVVVVLLTAEPNHAWPFLIPLAGLAVMGYGVARLFDYLKLKADLRDNGSKDPSGRLEARMDELERRMTDVQDILLSLTDKVDVLAAATPPRQLREG